ncbi:very long chain fatty acid elongase F-like [Drosophila kikkawai]|uniref:Elongation of very long chain fatty acids protein n=1 Tax=Drosophila kikkawai TaxID=30033 RepID=A0A6P4JIZ7_DROKI|nr:elongation of very long chain fatty acids protein F-like [Drosophila kikkawai]
MLSQIWDFLRTPTEDVHLPLLGSHWPVLTILGTYLLLVKVVGPRLMQNRKAFDLRAVIKVYNQMQIVYNLLMFGFTVHFMFGPGNFDLRCVRNLPLDHEYKNWERWLSYSYYLNKFIDMLETFFFILRKKDRQISFLHVFHHVYMVYIPFFYMHYKGYGGHGLFVVFWNMVVHSLMYIYYYQSALNRNSKAVIWWKKYMTTIQLVQFLIVLLHCTYTLFQPDCEIAKFSAGMSAVFAFIFLILFINFYIRNYILPKKKSK